MKHRIKAKKNKQLIYNNIFNPLIKNGLKIECIKFRNGYYVFNFGKNKVSSFKIKGIPDILFCVWNLNDGLKIFGDVIGYIDKFKPSHSILNFDNVNELISFANKIKNSYTESFANILKDKFIDDNEKLKENDVIISEYKEMIKKNTAISRNNGLTFNEIKECKRASDEFISYCKSVNIPSLYQIKPTIFYKTYAVYHILVDENNQNNDIFLGKVYKLRKKFFMIKLHSENKKIKELKKTVWRKNRKKVTKLI